MSMRVLDCGYVALVDSAPLVIAQELGFAADEGLELNLVQQPSWSALRDMLALGHLDAAQMLSPLPIAMTFGRSGVPKDVDALMVLSVNGTVFGLSEQIAAKAGSPTFGDPKALLHSLKEADITSLRVGVPFHYAMHRLLLSYWASTAPDLQIEVTTIAPPRMVDAVADGVIDAFWVGEPWGSVAVHRGVARLLCAGRHIWGYAPEKVLAVRRSWADANADHTRALMRAVFHAARWLDTEKNKPLAVEILASSAHLNLPPELIDPAIGGLIIPHRGAAPVQIDRFLSFHRHAAHFPWRSQAAWIAQHMGLQPPDIARAKACFRSDLYRQNLGPIGADLPGASEKIEGAMIHETAVASSRGHMILAPDAFFDGKTFDFGKENRPKIERSEY